MTARRIAGVIVVLGVVVAACFYVTVSSREAFPTAEIRIGETPITVELADTLQRQREGLSGRKTLPPDYGMLFVYDFPRRISFWMMDTSIPLSIAFISSDGTILQIEDMTPFDLRPVQSETFVHYALEVNRGFFQENGIAVGARVDLTNVINREP